MEIRKTTVIPVIDISSLLFPSSSNTYRGHFPSSINGKKGLDLSSPHLNPSHELVKAHDPLHELNLWSMDGILTQYWDQMCESTLGSVILVGYTFLHVFRACGT